MDGPVDKADKQEEAPEEKQSADQGMKVLTEYTADLSSQTQISQKKQRTFITLNASTDTRSNHHLHMSTEKYMLQKLN